MADAEIEISHVRSRDAAWNTGAPEYCYECECYPCEKYEHVDEFDSFITHRRQKADLEKAKRIGIAAYNAEQSEKIQILQELLG